MIIPRSFPVFEKLYDVCSTMIRPAAWNLGLPSGSIMIGYDSMPRWRVYTQVVSSMAAEKPRMSPRTSI